VKPLPCLAAFACLALAQSALACGTCAEDKMAATYDHANAQRAAAAGRVMVYCELAGAWDAARVRRAAAQVRGLDVHSVRMAKEPAALSFALDPRQQSPQAAVLSLQATAQPGARIGIVRVVDPQGIEH
jgi:hypothetical protein